MPSLAEVTGAKAILARLQGVRRCGAGWLAKCPAHEDRNPSLSIGESSDKVLLHCFAGCRIEAVCAALGIRVSDLFARGGEQPKPVPLVTRESAEDAAWRVSDALGRLRRYYMDALHRAERLQAQIGEQAAARTEAEAVWERLARLAPISAFFLAAFEHVNRLDTAGLICFVGMTPPERRAAILAGSEVGDALAA